jgi:hypothetical protein
MRTAFCLHRLHKTLLIQGVRGENTTIRRLTARRQQHPGTYATLQQLAHIIARHFDNTPQPLDPLAARALVAPEARRTRVEAIMAPLRMAFVAGERAGENSAVDAPGRQALLAKRLRKMLMQNISRTTRQRTDIDNTPLWGNYAC